MAAGRCPVIDSEAVGANDNGTRSFLVIGKVVEQRG